jgi:hypothetical protein
MARTVNSPATSPHHRTRYQRCQRPRAGRRSEGDEALPWPPPLDADRFLRKKGRLYFNGVMVKKKKVGVVWIKTWAVVVHGSQRIFAPLLAIHCNTGYLVVV